MSVWGRVAADRNRFSRRTAMRGGLIGAAGVAGAALLGCGDDDATADDAATGTNGTPASVDEGAARHGGTLVAPMRIADDPDSLDPHQAGRGQSLIAMNQCYDQLVQFDPFELESIVSNLADSWEFPEENDIVFHLHEAEFHDETEFTSEDIAATFERITSPPEGVISIREGMYQAFDSVETPDERTAVFHLTRPSASLLSIMAMHNAAIFSARDIHDDAFDHASEVNGTGPFILDQYDRGSRMVWRRNPNYFDGNLPYVDGVEYHIIPEAVSRFAAFMGGDLDFYSPSRDQLADIESGHPEATIIESPSTSCLRQHFATWNEPWDDPRTWEAVALLTNKQDANLVEFDGYGYPGGPLLPGTHWSLPESELEQVPGYSGDDMDARRTEARQLLDAAGALPEGSQIQLIGRDFFEDWVVYVQDSFQRIGIESNLEILDGAEIGARLGNLDFTDHVAASSAAIINDPTVAFADHYITGATRNFNDLAIPEVDELYVQQDEAIDPDERVELAHEMQRAYLAVNPAEILIWFDTVKAVREYVHDFGEVYSSLFQGRKNQYVWLDR